MNDDAAVADAIFRYRVAERVEVRIFGADVVHAGCAHADAGNAAFFQKRATADARAEESSQLEGYFSLESFSSLVCPSMLNTKFL